MKTYKRQLGNSNTNKIQSGLLLRRYGQILVLLFNHAAHVLRSICMNVCVLHLGFIDQSDNVSFVSYVYFVLKKTYFFFKCL